MSCWHCGIILSSYTRGGWVAGSSPFTLMSNIFVTEFAEFSENIYEKLQYAINVEWRQRSKENFTFAFAQCKWVLRSISTKLMRKRKRYLSLMFAAIPYEQEIEFSNKPSENDDKRSKETFRFALAFAQCKCILIMGPCKLIIYQTVHKIVL